SSLELTPLGLPGRRAPERRLTSSKRWRTAWSPLPRAWCKKRKPPVPVEWRLRLGPFRRITSEVQVNRNSFRVYGLTCVLAMVALAAGATTIVLPTDEQLIAKAPVIIDGTVVSTNPVDLDGTIWTDTVVSVAQTLKGTVDGTITVREIG